MRESYLKDIVFDYFIYICCRPFLMQSFMPQEGKA